MQWHCVYNNQGSCMIHLFFTTFWSPNYQTLMIFFLVYLEENVNCECNEKKLHPLWNSMIFLWLGNFSHTLTKKFSGLKSENIVLWLLCIYFFWPWEICFISFVETVHPFILIILLRTNFQASQHSWRTYTQPETIPHSIKIKCSFEIRAN